MRGICTLTPYAGISNRVSSNADVELLRFQRVIYSAILWNVAHLPFIMGYVIAGASLSRLVLATDCSDADAEDLTEVYVDKAESEVPIGLRWYYCAGLSVALLFMGMSTS